MVEKSRSEIQGLLVGPLEMDHCHGDSRRRIIRKGIVTTASNNSFNSDRNRPSGRSRSFEQRAKELVPAAHVFAISSYTNTVTRFPIVKSVEHDHWDFILSVGGIFVAISQLNHESLSEDVKDTARDAATQAADQWHPRAVEAIDDCTRFVDRTYDGLQALPEYSTRREFLFSDSLGSWVVWNLFRHAPEKDEERQLVRALGGMLVHTYMSWWKGAKPGVAAGG